MPRPRSRTTSPLCAPSGTLTLARQLSASPLFMPSGHMAGASISPPRTAIHMGTGVSQ